MSIKSKSKVMTALLLLSGAVAAAAQTPPSLPTPEKGGADTSAASRAEVTRQSEAGLNAAGQAGALQAMRALVRSEWKSLGDRYKPGFAGSQDTDQERIAQVLVLLGYTPRDLGELKANGRDVVLAAQNVVLARSTLQDELLLAPTVIVGELSEVRYDDSPGDGYGSTATFRNVQAVKGEQVPAEVSVRQRSGTGANASIIESDFRPGDTGRYVMFLSASAYALQGGKGRASAAPTFTRILLPYRVDQERLEPTALGQQAGYTTRDLTR